MKYYKYIYILCIYLYLNIINESLLTSPSIYCLIMDTFPNSNIDMKLQVNKDAINKSPCGCVPFSMAEPIKWASKYKSSILTLCVRNEMAPSIVLLETPVFTLLFRVKFAAMLKVIPLCIYRLEKERCGHRMFEGQVE